VNSWLPTLGELRDWSFWWYVFRSGIEISLLFLLIYQLLRAFERISAGGKIRGISLIITGVVAAAGTARLLELHAISWLLQTALGLTAIVLCVVFQPELRRLLTRMGGLFPNQDLSRNADIIPALTDAVSYLSDRRIGALIVIERGDRLDDYIKSSPIDCDVTAKTVTTFFWKDTPLHDGAMIIRDARIAAAGVILPLTENVEYKHLPGTRHRAGIGISEDTDALVILVSEETGTISVADRGKLLRGINRQDLEVLLGRVFAQRARRKAGRA
jgi:diadenylate cyclase